MEEEERALHKETSREQQQMMDKVENCRSIASFQLLSCLWPNRHKNFQSCTCSCSFVFLLSACVLWLAHLTSLSIASDNHQGCREENTKAGSLTSPASFSCFGNSKVYPSLVTSVSHPANLSGLPFYPVEQTLSAVKLKFVYFRLNFATFDKPFAQFVICWCNINFILKYNF